ncbi:hypothetical protein ScPMuIL_016029 [Solemya velum]
MSALLTGVAIGNGEDRWLNRTTLLLMLPLSMSVVHDEMIAAEFQPVFNKHAVLHMAIHVCDAPYSDKVVWDCSTPVKLCGPVGREPLFAWAKDAPGWKLPDNAGISLGNRSRHLILQVHARSDVKTSSVEGPYTFTGMEVTLRDSRYV